MRRFLQRRRDPIALRARLEARRSRARPEFVRALADELNGSRRQGRPALRLAFAGALTLMMLVGAGTVGGAGYAASAVESVTRAVKGGGSTAVALRASQEDDDDPDDDQYEEERRECRRAVKEAHKQFHAEHRSGHRVFHEWMRLALRDCDDIGGDDERAQ